MFQRLATPSVHRVQSRWPSKRIRPLLTLLTRHNCDGDRQPILQFPGVARTRAQVRDWRIAWAFWGVLLVAVCLFVAFGPLRTVTHSYFSGAADWNAQRSLYGKTGEGFLYLPQAAVVFVPFTFFPELGRELLWRCFTIGVFAWGVRRLAGLAEASCDVPLFGLATAISIPLAWSSARNGQATLPMAGLMMIAIGHLSTAAWWRAAGCLKLSLAIKPLALVLILLSAAVYGPMRTRLVASMFITAAIPFLLKNPAYVVSQYAAFARTAGLAADHSQLATFAQVFGMLRVVGLDVSEATQTFIRAGFAGLTLLACLVCSRRMEASRWGVYLYTLTACYLMLFNPRTENNTYSMLGPAVGAFLARSVLVDRRILRSALLALVAIGTLGTYEIGRLITSPAESMAGLRA